MLGNLTKHEFRATSRILPLFYLAILATAVPTVIFNAMNYAVMSVIFSILLILAGTFIIYGTVIYLVIRFYKGVYGPEGYLTMTLPVDESQILLSRGIVGFAWVMLSSVCFITTYSYALKTMLHSSQSSAEEIAIVTNMFSGGFMWFLLISSVIGNLALLAEVYMCVTIAQVKPFRKLGLGAAVICYVILYFAQQIISLPLTIFVPLSIYYTPNTGWGLSNIAMYTTIKELYSLPPHANNLADSMNFYMGIAAMFLPIIMLIVCSLITARLTKKKVNIR